jgi:hypothetical protein
MIVWAWWGGLPASIREPLKSAIVATGIALQTAFFVLLGAAVQAGQAGDPLTLLRYFWAHAWGVAIGILLPAAYRARQSSVNTANTVNLPNGASAILIPPKGVQ